MRLALDVQDEIKNGPGLALYRERTVALLKKYFRMSVELGHLPSVMGREFFRSHVSSYGTQTFEDAVIFVHDVERCLEKIHHRHQTVITTLIFQQYTAEEAATLLACCMRTMVRWRDEALDAVSAMFLERHMLQRLPVLEYDEDDENHGKGMTRDELPPKKGPKGVKDIQAVAALA